MRFPTRHLTSCLLALVIGFTSLQLAAARGQSPAVGTMVICTGTGPVHILVDANGQPTGKVMICPDYALAFFADVWTETASAQRHDAWQPLWSGRPAPGLVQQARMQAQARGPPRVV